MSDTTHDVIIIGGSYAGLSAALQLARARRKVLIIDEGLRRNRFAAQAHGFLTQDGVDPAAIAATARAQVMAYPSVAWVTGRAQTARKVDGATSGAAIFEVTVGDSSHRGRRLILAPGVRDILPRIEGLQERWGKSVLHCPYCHGYELDRGRIGVIAGSEMSLHQALMLPDWGPTTLLLNAALTPEARQLEALADRGITVEPMPVTAIRGHADVLLADGRTLAFSGLFTLAPFEVASAIPQQLGLQMTPWPLGAIIRTDAQMQTSMADVFACGDAAHPLASVARAVGDGSLAGICAHRSLVFGTLPPA